MAQRKSSSSKSTGGSGRPAGGPGRTPSEKSGATTSTGAKSTATKSSAAKSTAAKSTAAKSTAAKSTAAKRPPAKKPKSIVNQKQTPWGMISAAVAVVLFAAAVVTIVVVTRKDSSPDTQSGGNGKKTTVSSGGQSVDESDPYRQPELGAAAAISGVTYTVQGSHTHVDTLVKYDSSPPVGGDHSPLWADCTGVVYDHQLANENAVHALEHGAVWVTYNPSKLSKAQIATLAKNVDGVDRTLMTPYAGLKSAVSLQAWGYQLFVNSPTDPRIATFIKTLAGNPKTWPEQGASCTDPYWDASKSKPGSPQELS